jgi:hypothetical protein
VRKKKKKQNKNKTKTNKQTNLQYIRVEFQQIDRKIRNLFLFFIVFFRNDLEQQQIEFEKSARVFVGFEGPR